MYSNAGDYTCTQCPAGYKCPEKHMAPLLCESGYYAEPGAMICTICPSGHKCPQDARQPTICEQGKWAHPGSYECFDCPSGSACNNAGGINDSDTKTDCELYEITTDYHTSCMACPAGYDCPLQIFDYIRECGPGFYSLTTMDYCQVASTGTYAATTVASPTSVDTGYFADIGMTY